MAEELTDAQLVELLRSDRTAGFDLLYRRYAQRLFAYSVTVVQDRAAAEDATHESLMAAVAKIDNLRSPDQLRSWLFAITRNRCLTMATERNRFTDAPDVLDMIPVDEDPTAGVARHDSQALVAQALAGLAPADRDTLALALRHDLEMADVALAMGSNQPTARARISRAKAALTGSVTGLLLARDATDSQAPQCEGLQQALAGFTGGWTPLIRKRVAKHAKSCAQCDERGHQRALQYVSAFTLPVALVLAPQARARADEGLATLDANGAGEWLTWGSDGFPQTVAETGRRAGLLFAGAAGIALLLIGLVTWQVNAEPPVPDPTPSMSALPTPSVSPSPTPSPSPSDKPAAKSSPAKEKPPRESTPDEQGQQTQPEASDPQPTEAEADPKPTETADPQSRPTKPPKEPTPQPPQDEPSKEPKPQPEPEPNTDPPKDPAPEPEPEPKPEPEPEPEPTKPTAPDPKTPPIKGTDPAPDIVGPSDQQGPIIE